jgi:16S rRNA (cytosine1402-N4)-methyltransferase
MTSLTVHIPVLPAEILQLGSPSPGETWVDGTAGGGGHCQLIAERIGEPGTLLAIDRDPQAVARLREVLGANAIVKHGSYDALPTFMDELKLSPAAGILLDLGLSSDQLADRERGFSFQTDGELDMRFDQSSGEPAWEWLRRVDETTLADTIYRYGEERFSRRIAKNIVDSRKAHPIRTASELRDLIYRSVPLGRPSKQGRKHGRVDPATRTFQALRIAVNEELSILEQALRVLPDCLAEGGRLLIISFHSLEDRLVKYAFRGDERLKIVTRRPVQAGDEEVSNNPRSRSAKLRVALRLPIADVQGVS